MSDETTGTKTVTLALDWVGDIFCPGKMPLGSVSQEFPRADWDAYLLRKHLGNYPTREAAKSALEAAVMAMGVAGGNAGDGTLIPHEIANSLIPNAAMECLLEAMRDHPGAISPYAGHPAVAWALETIERLRSFIMTREAGR